MLKTVLEEILDKLSKRMGCMVMRSPLFAWKDILLDICLIQAFTVISIIIMKEERKFAMSCYD